MKFSLVVLVIESNREVHSSPSTSLHRQTTRIIVSSAYEKVSAYISSDTASERSREMPLCNHASEPYFRSAASLISSTAWPCLLSTDKSPRHLFTPAMYQNAFDNQEKHTRRREKWKRNKQKKVFRLEDKYLLDRRRRRGSLVEDLYYVLVDILRIVAAKSADALKLKPAFFSLSWAVSKPIEIIIPNANH